MLKDGCTAKTKTAASVLSWLRSLNAHTLSRPTHPTRCRTRHTLPRLWRTHAPQCYTAQLRRTNVAPRFMSHSSVLRRNFAP